jgi:hypothetical protein
MQYIVFLFCDQPVCIQLYLILGIIPLLNKGPLQQVHSTANVTTNAADRSNIPSTLLRYCKQNFLTNFYNYIHNGTGSITGGKEIIWCFYWTILPQTLAESGTSPEKNSFEMTQEEEIRLQFSIQRSPQHTTK